MNKKAKEILEIIRQENELPSGAGEAFKNMFNSSVGYRELNIIKDLIDKYLALSAKDRGEVFTHILNTN